MTSGSDLGLKMVRFVEFSLSSVKYVKAKKTPMSSALASASMEVSIFSNGSGDFGRALGICRREYAWRIGEFGVSHSDVYLLSTFVNYSSFRADGTGPPRCLRQMGVHINQVGGPCAIYSQSTIIN